MAQQPKYYLVEATALPEIFLKVAEAKRMLQTGEVDLAYDIQASDAGIIDDDANCSMYIGTGLGITFAGLNWQANDNEALCDRRVRLVGDPTQDARDRYGRRLAYVVLRGSGADLGERQVRAGWAEVYVFDRPFRRVRRYRHAAGAARAADRGVNGRCDGDFHSEQ